MKLLRDTTWKKIRDQFSEAEKKILRASVTEQTICPQGVTINMETLPQALKEKLLAELEVKGA